MTENNQIQTRPFYKSYWVTGRLLAGPTFYSWDPNETLANLDLLQAVGVTAIVSLIDPEELAPEEGKRAWLLSELQKRLYHHVFSLRNAAVPSRKRAAQILDTIDHELAGGRTVYLHCSGGRGRTGTIVGCWLARHAIANGGAVLEQIRALRQRAYRTDPSPETKEQSAFVVSWKKGE